MLFVFQAALFAAVIVIRLYRYLANKEAFALKNFRRLRRGRALSEVLRQIAQEWEAKVTLFWRGLLQASDTPRIQNLHADYVTRGPHPRGGRPLLTYALEPHDHRTHVLTSPLFYQHLPALRS